LKRHRYTDFQIWTSFWMSEEERKALEEDLKNPNSDIRRDVRRLFKLAPPGEYYLSVAIYGSPKPRPLPLPSGGCVIKFRKIR